MKSNAGFIHQFHSTDDHCIPISEARFVAGQLKGPNHVYEELSGFSHFFGPFQPLLDCVDKYAAALPTESIFEARYVVIPLCISHCISRFAAPTMVAKAPV